MLRRPGPAHGERQADRRDLPQGRRPRLPRPVQQPGPGRPDIPARRQPGGLRGLPYPPGRRPGRFRPGCRRPRPGGRCGLARIPDGSAVAHLRLRRPPRRRVARAGAARPADARGHRRCRADPGRCRLRPGGQAAEAQVITADVQGAENFRAGVRPCDAQWGNARLKGNTR
ncbi:hypothetical protein SCOCK_130058 [Actinacidiphila cocklensis]|uniref:Uncharacterized protein n=1 Tax=Actinacidiphila cocklensis TaxID=887465 RepID=A0A9W4DKD4_9ACTN|nr:hypothetical protein SCOCK_130058 [Actinacidiphila cocklensis]